MGDARTKRLNRELADVAKDRSSNITVQPVNEDIGHLIGTFQGPQDTPYEGGVFKVDIVVPPSYPFAPLKMKFITRVYHPNVSSQSGAICLDILKDAWSPVLTLKTSMVSLQSLLCSPEPSDPQDAEVAKVYMSDRQQFDKTARYWTQTYASGKDSDKVDKIQLAGLDPAHVNVFTGMGFDKDRVIDVLSRLNYRGSNVSNISEDTGTLSYGYWQRPITLSRLELIQTLGVVVGAILG